MERDDINVLFSQAILVLHLDMVSVLHLLFVLFDCILGHQKFNRSVHENIRYFSLDAFRDRLVKVQSLSAGGACARNLVDRMRMSDHLGFW